MSNQVSAGQMLRLRVLPGFSICVGLVLLAASFPPVSSGARAPLSPAVQQQQTTKGMRRKFVPGEVLVRYRNEFLAKSRSGASRITALNGDLLPIDVQRFDGSDLVEGIRLVHVAPEDTLPAVAALNLQSDVLYAEPNYILRADVTNPNDTYFQQGRQYGLTKIGAPQAWDTKTGSTGAGRVVIGVIDQGIDTDHQDLQANIWTNPAEIAGNGVDDDGNGFIDDVHGFNFVDNNGTVFSGADSENHATHVAGIAGATGNNNAGIAGVNWSVGLMSLKFLSADGFGDTADALSAVNYAKQMRHLWETTNHAKGANVRVVNASFGGAEFSQAFLDAVNQLNAPANEGILFVAAAGNVDNGTREPNNELIPHFPSSFNASNIISVAATDQNDALASFSHFGATSVDLGAPGVSILSTTPPCGNPGQDCLPDLPVGFGPTTDTYSSFSGTSMSAPHVSGAAALLWAQNPNLTAQQVKSLLLFNGDVVPALVDKSLSGRRLNVGNSMQALAVADAVAPGTVGSFHINSQNGRALNIGWTASGDDGAAGQASLYEVDFTDGTSGQVIPLKGVIPKASGSLQSVDVRIPFRHLSGTLTVREFDNVGNEGASATLAIGIPLSAGDPYTITEGASAALTNGGASSGLTGDDRYADFALPFSFPFFGQNFTELTLSTNGAVYFDDPPVRTVAPGNLDNADDPPGSLRALGGHKMIAGLWEDLDLNTTRRPDAGVYVTSSANQIIFRWKAVPCGFNGSTCTGGSPVDFEIELNSNGVIRTRYGNSDPSLVPTVGLGGGEQDGYVVASHTSLDEQTPVNLTNAGQVTYTPRAQSTSTIQLSAAATNANEPDGLATITVTRTGDLAGFATVNYTTSDTAGLQNCTVVNGKGSERCDYETAAGTLRFSTGENTKTFVVPIVNDVLVEGNETFTVTLSGVNGANLGTSVETVTIVDNDAAQANQNPIDDIPFFVTQQYIDFLGRLPDTVGFNNWVATLNGCPNGGFGENDNPNCDRVHVSAGFFLSTEFQGRGYFAYRFYEVAVDRRPTYAEFVPDMALVGGPQSPDSEVLSKASYTEAWTQRPEFKGRYDALSNSAYVDALETNAEIAVANKAALVAALNNGQMSRGEVLRNIVESQPVFDRFFNRAFVAMQYFGYLRRDPDTVGFNNWLNTLNADPSNFRHMIFGFLFSTEYRQRFGP